MQYLVLLISLFGIALRCVMIGFGGIFGNYLAGVLADIPGVNWMMYLLSIPGIVGLLLFFFGSHWKLIDSVRKGGAGRSV